MPRSLFISKEAPKGQSTKVCAEIYSLLVEATVEGLDPIRETAIRTHLDKVVWRHELDHTTKMDFLSVGGRIKGATDARSGEIGIGIEVDGTSEQTLQIATAVGLENMSNGDWVDALKNAKILAQAIPNFWDE